MSEQECAEMRRQFDLYELDLPAENAALPFETHFKTCSQCRSWLASWDLVKVAAHKLGEEEVPAFVFDNIMTAVTPVKSTAGATVVIAKASSSSLIKSSPTDLATMLFGFGILVLCFTIFGSATFDESISWCLSFALLIGFNQLTRTKAAVGAA